MPPLIGDGITEDNVLDYTYYICGPCSCQIKYQNPGMDLLVSRDWYAFLEGSEVVKDKELPPLSGVSDLTEEKGAEVLLNEQGLDETTTGVSRRSVLGRTVGVSIVFIIALIIAGSVVLRMKQK